MKRKNKIKNIALSIAGLMIISIFALIFSDSRQIFDKIYVGTTEENISGENVTDTETAEVLSNTTVSDETEENPEGGIMLLADPEVTINSAADLVKYSNDYLASPAEYQTRNVKIAITSGDLNSLNGFSSIGTEEYPFDAEFRIERGSEFTLNKPLFAYIMDSAKILDLSGNSAAVTISRSGSAYSALFAENVIHNPSATGPADWKVNIGINEAENSFAGVIGTMEESAAVQLTVNNYMTNAISIVSSGDTGFACGKMKSNSSLTLSLSGSTLYKVTSKGANAGGMIGAMESGSVFTLENSFAFSGDVTSTGYAGGLVGYANNAIVRFEENATVSGTVIGGLGTGGVFGYYKNTAENNSFDLANYNVSCTLNGANAGGIFGELENSGNMTISQSAASLIAPKRTDSSTNNYGGLIGTYLSENTYNSLDISGISVTVEKTGGAENYGGFVGKISDESYIRFENSSVDATGCNTAVTTFGGLVGYVNGAFIDAENVTVNTDGEYIGGGVVGNMNSGVLRLSGTTSLAGAKASSGGQIVGARGNRALIYAKNEWKLIRSTEPTGYDDIGTWGTVLRLGANLNESDIFTVDETAHTVTIKGASTTVNSLADFAKLALNIQMNDGTQQGTLKFADTANTGSVLMTSNITLNCNIDLTGTGITALTRDDGNNAVYTGTFDGSGHTITLAIGEPYGYRGNDSNVIAANDPTDGNGCIHRHHYNALFARTGNGATFKNVTINGIVNVRYKDTSRYYLGGLSGNHTNGAITAENVTTRVKLSLVGTGVEYSFAGGIVGYTAEGSNPEITIKDCYIAPEISYLQNGCKFICGGVVGDISPTKSFKVTVEKITVGTTATNNSTSSSTRTGGLIGNMGNYKDAVGDRTVSLKNVTIDGASIESKTGGGLLGEAWNNADVTIGSEVGNDGITVKNSSVKHTGTGGFAGLVRTATGYWRVYDVNINSITVNGSSSSSYGMLINKGINEDNSKKFALYLELESENAYKITAADMSGLKASAVYDDIIATCSDSFTADNVLKNDKCAVISIHTSGNSLIMDGANCNTYQNQTSIKKFNPNSRYYYNLDVIRAKNSAELTSAEKLLLWSVNKYAYSNIKKYFTNSFVNTIPTGTYDMTGYSYYPIDVTSAVTIAGGSSFTFCNDKLESGESGTGNSDSTARTTMGKTQHYLMHCGLFINSNANINTGASITFSGCVGSDSNYSGALLCGTLQGSNDAPVKAAVGGITLDGIRINGVTASSEYAPLLINRIDSYSELSLNNVTTTGSYKTNGISIAATSLIGNVGSSDGASSDIKLTFSRIALDGRKTALSNSDANSALNTAYNTDLSIFSKATLLNSFKFTAGSNCSGLYNFKINEDWNEDATPKHKVTYGSEISNSAEYDGLQEKYLRSDIYTDPTKNNADSEYTFNTCFLPYVAAAYSASNNFHEIKVNQSVQVALDEGCGTYNDPYIISEGKQLELLDKVLSGNLGVSEDGTVINYKSDNYKVQCADRNSHAILIWTWNSESSKFESDNGSVSVELSDMQSALATAYYKLSNDITVSSADFLGIGKNVPFKGVIYGNGKTIENSTPNPLIYQSKGAVVKDVTIRITADFSGKFAKDGSSKYETDGGSTEFYGGVIGIVNGGDNIIDSVGITFTKAGTINIKSGSCYGNKAVGGYIGVVRYGGVIFRNMDTVASNKREGITSSQNSMFKSTGDFKDSNGKVLLYCNPIIGRVIDGYAVTEATSYNGDENSVTMHNGTKNYSIADINKNDDRITFSNFTQPTGNINSGTVYIKNAQQLFLLGCISMSGAGSASSSGVYPTAYSYGNGQMARHAKYNDIGTDNTADFNLAVTDSFSQDNVPYIIYKYTDQSVQGANNDTIAYPAKCITNDSFVFNIELTQGTYNMPNGFRGIGSLSSTATNLVMFINGIDGNNSNINLNMNFYMYRNDYEKYYVSDTNSWKNIGGIDLGIYNVGLGLFNTLVQNNTDFTPEGFENDTTGKYYISDLTISGTVNHEVYESESQNAGYNSKSYFSCAGGLAGCSTTSCIMADNVNLLGLTVNARFVSGGLIGAITGDSDNNKAKITNFSANDLSVGGGMFAGGLIASSRNSIVEINGNTDNGNNANFKFGSIYSKSSTNNYNHDNGTGGLIGTVVNSNKNIPTSVTIQNIDMEGESVTSYGGSAFVGGIIGCCGNTKNKVDSFKVSNINFKNVDVNKDSDKNIYCGGVVGSIKESVLAAEISKVHITSTDGVKCINGGTISGGVVGLLLSSLKIDNCSVKNYILSGFGTSSSVEGVGGFIGKAEDAKTSCVKNCLISDCILKSIAAKPAGGIVGTIRNNAKVNGYNIAVNNVKTTDKDGKRFTSGSFGDVAGQIDSGSHLKLVGVSMHKKSGGIYNGTDIGKNSGTAYVIFSDYNGSCLETNPNKDVSTVNMKTVVDDMASFPYATINSKRRIDSTQFLTGDGADKTAINDILSNKGYNNVADEYTKFSLYESKLSTFNEKTGASIPDDIPVLVINEYNYRNVTEMLNSYIHILTNDMTVSNYAAADSSICNVDILPLRLNESSGVFETSVDFEKTLEIKNGYFRMTDLDYDCNYKQFTLIDVQYKDPTGSGKIAYHLYIPVYVEKMLNFDFRAAALSGTTYNTGAYTDGDPVIENYGTPVTAHITYSYKRTVKEWQNAINSGENLLSGYGKSVLLDVKGSIDLPDDTKLVLIDRNNYSKSYYSTIGEAFSASDKKLDFGKFSASGGTQFVPITFCDLLNRSADITAIADTNGTLVKCSTADTSKATIKIGSVYYRKKTDSDTDTTLLYSAQLAPKTGMTDSETGCLKVEEDYYISFFTMADDSAPVRNITVCCSTRLGDANMTPSHLDNDSYDESKVHMILGNLYDQQFNFETTGGEVINENNRTLKAKMDTVISLKPANAEDVKPYLRDSSIHLYHGFIIEALRTDAETTENGIKGAPRVTGTYKIPASDPISISIINTEPVITLTGSKGGVPMDIKEHLINSNSVTITCDDLTITYPGDESIAAQFPERKNQGETYGVTLSANSELAYIPDNIGRSNMYEKENDRNGKSYYRENISAASLSYNIPINTPNEMTKLGINGLETNENITAAGYYNVLNIPEVSFDKAKTVKFVLSLYQKNNDGGYEPVDIDKYLTKITVYDKSGNEKSPNSNSYEFLFNKDELNFEAGTFEVISSYSPITGAEIEKVNGMYSNYKVQLTAMLLDENGEPIENSGCSDYIIYTNAKVYSHMLH